MGAPMKGLVQFIADIRNAREREAESKRINLELINIQKQFANPHLNGYQKKKYICKLLYIYILGHPVEFGHVEAINLISSNVMTEKQIGYLAVGLLLNENHELTPLVVNSIKKDLDAPNDEYNCLALQCIASIGGKLMGQVFAEEVFVLLKSPTSQPLIRKKAALALLKLYRGDPTILKKHWIDRIISCIDDPEIGVAISAASLVTAIAENDTSDCQMCYPITVRKLGKIINDNNVPEDYFYYNVPAPWLQVKLFRLLQYFDPTSDQNITYLLQQIITTSIDKNSIPAKNVQQNNSQNSILFEVINLAIHLDLDVTIIDKIVKSLATFASSLETNSRYLALDALSHVSTQYGKLVSIKEYLPNVMKLLRDRDISVRRKALDLVYSCCDNSNIESITSELLKYLQNADFAIREEVVVKIAVLAERYANEYNWYVNTILKLIAVAGNYVSDDVWERVVQIVVNNENLQPYASKTVLQYLKAPSCHEIMVKVGAYVLGEYGHLIIENEGASPLDQFIALHDKFPFCAVSTKAMLLSTYLKFVNLFPEIKPQLVDVFEDLMRSSDSEIQQRACEYLKLSTMDDDELLALICDEIPPFPQRSSSLIVKLERSQTMVSSKNLKSKMTRQASTMSAIRAASASAAKTRQNPPPTTATGTRGSPMAPLPPQQSASRQVTPSTNGNSSLFANQNNSRMSIVDTTPVSETRPRAVSTAGLLSDFDFNFAEADEVEENNAFSESLLTPNWDIGYYRLLHFKQGIFFENSLIKLVYRSQLDKDSLLVTIYYVNKSPSNFTSFYANVSIPPIDEKSLGLSTEGVPESEIIPGGRTFHVIRINATSIFGESPWLKITFISGTLNTINLKLPIMLSKYLSPTPIDASSFFKRWNQIGGAPREVQQIFRPKKLTTTVMNQRLVEVLGWHICPDVDKSPNNIVAAGIIHTSSGNYGCLLRLEPNENNDIYRLSVRATNERVAPLLVKTLVDLFEH